MAMRGRSSGWEISFFFVAFLLAVQQLGLVSAQKSNSSRWLTLNGTAPAIIARGGFSGLFPDSSSYAYETALSLNPSDTIVWCDVQLTKDNVGICLPDIKLDNCTNIATVYPSGKKVYTVNGVPTQAWFSVDYNLTELTQAVALQQAIYSRTYLFDGFLGILSVDDVAQLRPPGLWLNIQHDIFYRQHNLSMRLYVLSVSRRHAVKYISSPEVGFLGSIEARFRQRKTKLVFRFLNEDDTEPSTNRTYGSLLQNLTFIKTFASGILVPNHYIWPVTPDNYLKPYTSIVMDVHKAGLEIFAADFANDNIISYNYSYDPLSEYLNFIDNGFFSVDGVLTDYPITPSEAIGCFAHINNSSIDHGKPVIISHNGASGDYPDCTDLAYQKAVNDNADVIDCTVQVTKDGTLICMGSPDLLDDTTVANSPFSGLISTIPDIKMTRGIYTFNLTWDEIQKNLKPTISAPYSIGYHLVRNPRYKNEGNFFSLSDFLSFAKGKDLFGILISIENAVFIVEKLGINIIDDVINAIRSAGYNQTTLEVMIQATDSSVLKKFKQLTKYKLVYKIHDAVSDALSSSIADIKEFADSVAITTDSIYPQTKLYITSQTDLVQKLQKSNISVYVHLLRNEFISQPWDYYSDATVQINSFVEGAGVDGIITDFPGTARRYKRNSCRNMGNGAPVYMEPVAVGANGLFGFIPSYARPPAMAPTPVLNDSVVEQPPLPPVASKTPAPPPGGGTAASPARQPSDGRPRCTASVFIISLAMLWGSLLFI